MSSSLAEPLSSPGHTRAQPPGGAPPSHRQLAPRNQVTCGAWQPCPHWDRPVIAPRVQGSRGLGPRAGGCPRGQGGAGAAAGQAVLGQQLAQHVPLWTCRASAGGRPPEVRSFGQTVAMLWSGDRWPRGDLKPVCEALAWTGWLGSGWVCRSLRCVCFCWAEGLGATVPICCPMWLSDAVQTPGQQWTLGPPVPSGCHGKCGLPHSRGPGACPRPAAPPPATSGPPTRWSRPLSSERESTPTLQSVLTQPRPSPAQEACAGPAVGLRFSPCRTRDPAPGDRALRGAHGQCRRPTAGPAAGPAVGPAVGPRARSRDGRVGSGGGGGGTAPTQFGRERWTPSWMDLAARPFAGSLGSHS